MHIPPTLSSVVEIDLCESGPCKNNATCSRNVGTYTCECSDGWMGTDCDGKLLNYYNETISSFLTVQMIHAKTMALVWI